MLTFLFFFVEKFQAKSLKNKLYPFNGTKLKKKKSIPVDFLKVDWSFFMKTNIS